MPQAIPFLTLAVAVGGTAASVSQARSAENDRRRAQLLSQRQAAEENQKAIREAIAASRAAQAGSIAEASASGIGFESSVVQGGIGAAQTQIASNVGFARQTAASNASINKALRDASAANSRASSFTAIAGLPAQFGLTTKAAAASIKEQFAKPVTPIAPA